tara:strand:+ start:52 stop:1122 length:1071 start_codon:yes stop_codon:yes gene_type:complete
LRSLDEPFHLSFFFLCADVMLHTEFHSSWNATAHPPTSPIPSLMLRGERHTGTNFLDAIITASFRRPPFHQRRAMAATVTLRTRKCYNFFGVSTPCYAPHGPFSGCVAQCSDPERQQCTSTDDGSRSDAASAEHPGSYCCWKHGAIDPTCRYAPRASAYVIAVREPYSWLVSLYRGPYEYLGSRQLKFGAFLRRAYSERPPYYVLLTRHPDPVTMWARRARSYLRVPPARRVLVPMEELFQLERLETRLRPLLDMGFERRPGLASIIYPQWATELNKYNKYWGRFDRAGFENAKRQLRNRSWAWQYTQADLDYINERLPTPVLTELGIQRIKTIARLRQLGAAAEAYTVPSLLHSR